MAFSSGLTEAGIFDLKEGMLLTINDLQQDKDLQRLEQPQVWAQSYLYVWNSRRSSNLCLSTHTLCQHEKPLPVRHHLSITPFVLSSFVVGLWGVQRHAATLQHADRSAGARVFGVQGRRKPSTTNGKHTSLHPSNYSFCHGTAEKWQRSRRRLESRSTAWFKNGSSAMPRFLTPHERDSH